MKYLFFSDAPPLAGGGHGNHGIACNIITALRGEIQIVSSRRARHATVRKDIFPACEGLPLFLVKDASGLGIRRFFPGFGSFLDQVLFIISLPFLLSQAKKAGADRILFLCGADASWLFAVKFFQLSGLPVDLYVVDDLERFAEVNNRRWLKKIARPLFNHVARRCSRLLSISKGYAEQIEKEHGVKAQWLPVPIANRPFIPENYQPCSAHVRTIVYTGAINHLYKDAIAALYDEIIAHNARADRKYDLHLVLMSYGNPSVFTKTLPHENFVTGYEKLSEDERIEKLREGFASFLPYSFHEDERKMVTTSFSCKLIEYFKAGRPLMVYGPEYASIPRYFLENELPLVAISRAGLQNTLGEIGENDREATIRLYAKTWQEHHSPEAVRAFLAHNL